MLGIVAILLWNFFISASTCWLAATGEYLRRLRLLPPSFGYRRWHRAPDLALEGPLARRPSDTMDSIVSPTDPAQEGVHEGVVLRGQYKAAAAPNPNNAFCG